MTPPLVRVRESAIESNNYDYARQLGIIFRKLNFGEGWPDRILLYKGNVLFIEYKQLGEKPTALQNHLHEQLRKQGFRVEVVDDKTKGRELIKDWYDRINQHVAEIRRSDDQNQRLRPYVQRDIWAEPFKAPGLDGEVRDGVPPVLRRGPGGSDR